MPEWSVAEVVGEGDGLGQILVQAQCTGDGASYLGDLQRVGEPCPDVVPGRRKEHLGLRFESTKRSRVHDAVAISLKWCPDRTGWLWTCADSV